MPQTTFTNGSMVTNLPHATSGLQLVPGTGKRLYFRPAARVPSARADFTAIATRRCAAFFAQAGVLALVLGVVDILIPRGRLQPGWIWRALCVALCLLSASILADFYAQRRRRRSNY